MNYYEQEPEVNSFKTVSIPLTYRCQLKCNNCYLGTMLNNTSEYPDVDYNKFIDFITALPKRCDIRFIGAEPTMHPNLTDFIKATRAARGHRPSLLTNGVKLKSLKYTQSLKDAGLNMLGLSMNGGIDDNMYITFDGGPFAKAKMRALENCIAVGIVPHINVIISPTNIHVLKPLFDFVVNTLAHYNVKSSTVKFPLAFRIKSIGKMGNYMEDQSYSLTELVDVFSRELGIELNSIDNNIDGYNECNSLLAKFDTDVGQMLVKFTDWTVDEHGLPDADNQRRGIMTDDYKVAPFFEYYHKEGVD